MRRRLAGGVDDRPHYVAALEECMAVAAVLSYSHLQGRRDAHGIEQLHFYPLLAETCAVLAVVLRAALEETRLEMREATRPDTQRHAQQSVSGRDLEQNLVLRRRI